MPWPRRPITGSRWPAVTRWSYTALWIVRPRTSICSVPSPAPPVAVVDSVRRALETAGFRVEVTRRPEDSGGEFAQLAISRNEEAMLLDLARDWRQLSPVPLDIGPVLHIDDAVGSKVTAMVGRGLPRDFIDVAAALARYGREELMTLAFVRDPGLRVRDFSDASRALDDIPADAFAAYGLNAAGIATMRAQFDDWPRDVSSDKAGTAHMKRLIGLAAPRISVRTTRRGHGLRPHPVPSHRTITGRNHLRVDSGMSDHTDLDRVAVP